MPQIKDLIEDLEFIRWVKNPEDKLQEYWQNWIEANPDRIEDVKLAREVILGLKFPSKKASPEVKKEVLNKLLQASPSEEEEKENSYTKNKSIKWKSFNQWEKIAAILVFALMLSLLIGNLSFFKEKPAPVQALKWINKTTNYGEKLNFRLPDGSIVWLNSGSSLEYPASFDSTVRLVKLHGEGFFEVTEDKNKPFKVLSENLTTTALGTSFNIKSSYQNVVIVSLVTGKVQVDDQLDNQQYLLSPGEQLDFDNENKKGKISNFDLEAVQSWRKGKLVFQKATFQKVKEDLERWYGVSIQVEGQPSQSWRFNGEFENQILDVILMSMSNIEDFSYKIDKKEVQINFN
ncbi:DUF4974 domain-containing protein [Echinicola jeungdonensis]|uniref:FecR family protein n=1 Tax=Echinicola jeungdonensis TaxID=709343 RepID=A0ABV5J9A9_9BACT|nr:FecR domain-containing protein [Echinicola jeungdonensis]MDN3669484.1 DUF4974 domain-containing protein [Echinicola jeungdonensis]